MHGFKILLYAHVDLNAVDGSALFVAGTASLLTSAPDIHVDVVAATPVKRPLVVHEMLTNEQVSLIDPYRDESVAAVEQGIVARGRMDETAAARVIRHYLHRDSYHIVLVRSTEVAAALAAAEPSLGSRLCAYVTGVVANDSEVPQVTLDRLTHLARAGATLLCQTPEMQVHLVELLSDHVPDPHVVVMSPSVPGFDGPRDRPDGEMLSLAYTGKFAPAWNSVEMLAGFREAYWSGAKLHLAIAGDYFKRSPDWPTFEAEVRHLLTSHPRIDWKGGVTRSETRALILNSDVGLSWRNRSLDSSLELSTKLLEYGVLGRPCIVNPTPMHRRLFGEEYPLYATTMGEFVGLLKKVSEDRGLINAAADIATGVAQRYVYREVFRDLFPALVDGWLKSDGQGVHAQNDLVRSIQRLMSGSAPVAESGGWYVARLADARDGEAFLGSVPPSTALECVQHFGPFVRWRVSDRAYEASQPSQGVHSAASVLSTKFASNRGSRSVADGSVIAHDVNGRVSLVSVPTAGLTDSQRRGRSMEEARQRVDRSRELEVALERRNEQIDRLKARYEALATSKLGRLQVKYWRLRKRLRARG